MKKKYIHIYQCRPGYILADDVYDGCGVLIIEKGTIINEYAIKRMKVFRIRQLLVYESQDEKNTEKGGPSLAL